MAERRNPRVHLGRTYALGEDMRVRLRLARFGDVRAITNLLLRAGDPELDAVDMARAAQRLVQFAPRERYVVCATALIDSSERLVGVGAIDLDRDEPGQPDLMVVDPELGPELPELLTGALVSAAESAARQRAA